MQKSSILPWLYLFILAFIWGSSFILIKKGLIGLTSQEVGSLRIVIASFFFLSLAINNLKKVEKKDYSYLLIVGFLGSLIPAFLFAIAQTQLESSITGVLNGLVPLFTILISWIFLQKKPSMSVRLGVLIGFVGTAILITAGKENAIGEINLYAFLVVLATMCYAFNLNLIKEKLHGLSAITVTSISLVLVCPIAIIYLIEFTEFLPKLMEKGEASSSIVYVCLLGIFGTSIALILFNKILQMKDALFASSVTYIIPIFAIMWGVLDGEKLYLWHYLGIVVICIGIYITNTNRYKNKGKKK